MSDSQSAVTRPPAVAPGNVAVITGGASGIGLAVAEAMIAEGMSVVLADIDAPKLRDVEARLSEDGASVATMVCNTTAEADVDALIEYAVEQFGGVHVMFNNAGIAGVGDAWTDPVELWKRVLDVNVLGVVYGIRAALPVMQEQGVGHIVSTASDAGLRSAPGLAPYVASKHAVVGLSESLFLELELTGSPVGASVLCPFFVKTDLMSKDKEPETVDSPVAQFINQVLAAGVDGGIPASEVADAVVAAIKAGRFWILTHDSTREASVARVQRAADGVNPPVNLPVDPSAAELES
jgi:NAD(P)-dependent dehydrogenase (short-subunit alcohol dehydrogenase family)